MSRCNTKYVNGRSQRASRLQELERDTRKLRVPTWNDGETKNNVPIKCNYLPLVAGATA